jgi:hypothetical protein
VEQETSIYRLKDGSHVESFPHDLLMSPDFKYGLIHQHGDHKYVRLADVDVERFKEKPDGKKGSKQEPKCNRKQTRVVE